MVMKNIACQLEHSVEAEVSPSFAWSWRTDIKNWDDRPPNFSSTARSRVAHGEQPCFRDKSLCAGKFVTFGQGWPSSWKCRSTGPSSRLSGCFTAGRALPPDAGSMMIRRKSGAPAGPAMCRSTGCGAGGGSGGGASSCRRTRGRISLFNFNLGNNLRVGTSSGSTTA